MQAAHAGCDGERDLRPRTETGMGRNGLVDLHLIGSVDIEDTLHGFEVASDPFALGTRHLHLRGRADRDAGAEPADGEADATEPTAEAAIEIQKAEMQPCRNCNSNVRGGRGAVQPLSPEIFPQPGFSNQNTAIYCGASRLFAISDELPSTWYRRW